MTTTDAMVCTCGGGPTTEVYHEPYCPLYRVQRAGSVLLTALEAVETLGLYGNDKHNARSTDRVADLVTAAIRKAQEG